MTAPADARRTADGHQPPRAGCRPGRELPRAYRELIAPLLTADAGWRYFPTNGNGKGKPRLLGPAGQQYALPNTPSDNKCGLKNTRAGLRRLGAAV